MYILTGVKEYGIKNLLKFIADGGYSHKQTLVTPNEAKGQSWNQQQRALRSIVECVIGLVHTWGPATIKFRGTPELQEIVLMIIYEIVNMRLMKRPLGLRG